MFKFGRRKKKEDEEVDGESTKELEKPKRTRKKKEEPPKKWGRGERILVLSVLSSTVIVAVALALSARSWKLPGLPRIKLPSGALEETYVFEGKPPERDTTEVINEFNKITDEASGVYGFYVLNLNTEETYGANINETFQAASLIKLPVMAAMYSEDEEKHIDLDDIYTLRDEDKVGGSGSIAYEEAGTTFSYRELINYMGQQSDNTAFKICVDTLGVDFLNSYIKEIGMESTSYDTNETTPYDIGIYFKKLWKGKIIQKKNRDELLKSLTNTIYEDFIPAGIPDVRVAHKFGREVHVINDAGIVFAKNPYVLIIMSKGIVESEAEVIIPDIAELVHRFESEQDI